MFSRHIHALARRFVGTRFVTGRRLCRSLTWLVACGLAVSLRVDVCAQRLAFAQAPQHTNALKDADSPYLLQHAHNPVNWFAWGPAALAKAKAENKPIFLSIGYSTCYWCHVMERESFENEEIAAILNEHYVAIKVDREQRPDIDEQMMLATQLLTGRGGWPTSVWLTSDGRPWMAGTYFPPTQFAAALQQLARVWVEEAEAVEKQAAALTQAVQQASRTTIVDAEVASEDSAVARLLRTHRRPLDRALAELQLLFDEQHAGFGTHPKFPPHGALRLLCAALREQPQASQPQMLRQQMLLQTLHAMYRGGIHDHVGGGFHRYSTDAAWRVPHFEKMLYDNAQLLRSYVEAYEITGDALCRAAAYDIVGWVRREMTHPAGGFYSALDSESDGREGGYYVWTEAELRATLAADEADVFARLYNFEEGGNYAEEASGEKTGANIPLLTQPLEELEPSTLAQLDTLKDKLLKARTLRSYPHLDGKVLTSWNGLMITALAEAGRVFEDPQLVSEARRAAEFVLNKLQTNVELLHTWHRDSASVPAYLDDYAFMIEGLLALHRATDQAEWLSEARRLADAMLQNFEDLEQGGFFFTGPQHETLLVRSKNLLGGGNIPTGNGVALQALIRLYELTKQREYLDSAQRGVEAFAELALQAPRQVEHIVLAHTLFDTLANSMPDSVAPQTTADAEHRDSVVTAQLYMSHVCSAPGARLMLAVKLQIADGYHVVGPTPGKTVEGVAPVRLELRTPATWHAENVQYPPVAPEFDPILDTKLVHYQETVWLILPIEVAADAELTSYPLRLQITYQACDQTRCLPAEQFELTAKIEVADASPASSRHPDIFREAALTHPK